MEFKDSQVTFKSKNNFRDDLKRFAVDEAAKFTTDSNEAASASLDEMAEKAIRLSAEKNKRKISEQKQILREIKEKKKELEKNPINLSATEFTKETDKKFSNDALSDKETKQNELNKKQDTAKKEKSKEQKKASVKTSVATMLRAKKDMSNDLVNDKPTGNAFTDGVSGLLKTFVDFINPMRWVKSLLAKLAAILAPYIAIFMVIATVVIIIIMFIFSVLQPINSVGDAITGYLSSFQSEPDVYASSLMSDGEIDDIVNDITCDDTQKKVIRYALSKVGYAYSQAKRTSGLAYDCSSLAYYSWNAAGVDISFGTGYPPTAAEGARMLNEKGKTIDTMDLTPGDLIYYGGSSNGRYMGIYHVAIYIGNGNAVEALNESCGVVYQKLRTKNAIMVARPNK